MKNLKAIIFDLGGVILNIDYRLTEKAFQALGIPRFTELYSQHAASQLFSNLETGDISASDFIKAMQQEAGVPLDAHQITTAWNAMLLDFPEERLTLLRKLREKYPIYLLSNTNAIHEIAFNHVLKERFALDSLDPLFTKAYLSHRIHLRKPDPEAFRHVLTENNLDPASTLFIDDTEVNILAARALGLQTILLRPPVVVTDLEELHV